MEEGNTVHVQAYFQFILLTTYWLYYDQHNTTVNTYRRAYRSRGSKITRRENIVNNTSLFIENNTQ